MPIQRSVVFIAALALLIVSLHSVVAAPLAQNGLPADMLGATWELTALQTAPGNNEDTQGTGVTIVFNADGTANGLAGCNNFNGGYTAGANNAISFGPLATTRMFCEPAVNDLEARYLAALENVASYALDGPNRLALQSADGNTVLRYIRPVAAPLPATGAASSNLALILAATACLWAAGLGMRRWTARRT